MKYENLIEPSLSQGLSVIKPENLIPKGHSLTNILLGKKKKKKQHLQWNIKVGPKKT